MDNLLKVYYREHPTLLLTVGYFIVTVIGIIYSYFFYAEFGINILKFADISDFLLASILEPLSLMIFVGWLLFYYISYKLDLWFRVRFKGYGNWVENRLKAKYTDPLAFIIVMTIFYDYVRQRFGHQKCRYN